MIFLANNGTVFDGSLVGTIFETVAVGIGELGPATLSTEGSIWGRVDDGAEPWGWDAIGTD